MHSIILSKIIVNHAPIKTIYKKINSCKSVKQTVINGPWVSDKCQELSQNKEKLLKNYNKNKTSEKLRNIKPAQISQIIILNIVLITTAHTPIN